MSHLFLSHLSRNNNSPRIVRDMFRKIAGRTEIVIASRDKETKVYQVRNLPGRVFKPYEFVNKQTTAIAVLIKSFGLLALAIGNSH